MYFYLVNFYNITGPYDNSIFTEYWCVKFCLEIRVISGCAYSIRYTTARKSAPKLWESETKGKFHLDSAHCAYVTHLPGVFTENNIVCAKSRIRSFWHKRSSLGWAFVVRNIRLSFRFRKNLLPRLVASTGTVCVCFWLGMPRRDLHNCW